MSRPARPAGRDSWLAKLEDLARRRQGTGPLKAPAAAARLCAGSGRHGELCNTMIKFV